MKNLFEKTRAFVEKSFFMEIKLKCFILTEPFTGFYSLSPIVKFCFEIK